LATAKPNTTGAGGQAGSIACRSGNSGTAGRARRTKGARKFRIERIRKEIKDGTYETEGKLRIAISRLIDDVLARCRKRRD